MNIAHLWAAHNLDGQEVKPLKKNTGQGSNFYWEGDTIYSYGRHFPIARVIEHKKKKAVLFTTRTYSVTTSNHISYTWRALQGRAVPQFNVVRPDETPSSAGMKAAYQAKIDAAFEAAKKALSRTEMILRGLYDNIEEANKCAAFFGWGWRLKAPKGIKPLEVKAVEQTEKAKIRKEKKRARDKAAYEAREKRRAEAEPLVMAYRERRRQAWLEGRELDEEAPEFLYSFQETQRGPLLRIKDSETVETSRGAEVPVSHAKRLMALIQKIKATGKEYVRNGHTEHVGAFAVDWIKADGSMKAGCHTFEAAEIERFRPILEAVK